ncbi:unnamed protein product [Debaryomyces tyrocola]|nr:unnamed protein product [Debaryomyces tyrocola]
MTKLDIKSIAIIGAGPGGVLLQWYQEEFDAVVIANCPYTVPNIPHIEGLAKFNELNPDILIHSKSYRSAQSFKDNKVLIVGGSFSSANLLQYVVPLAKQTFISKRGPHLVLFYKLKDRTLNIEDTLVSA